MGRVTATVLAAVLTCSTLYGDEVRLDLDKPDGIYEVGEEARIALRLDPAGELAPPQAIRYVLNFETEVVKTETLELGAEPVVLAVTGERPGWFYLGLEVLGADGKPRKDIARRRTKPTIVAEIGFLFNPGKIRAVDSRPEDYDAFWQGLRGELDAVPVTATATPTRIPDRYKDAVACYEVTVACAGGRPVTGYLAMPRDATEGSLPALVYYMGMSWTDARRMRAVRAAANDGVLAFAPSWHGLPTAEPVATYKEDPQTGKRAWYNRTLTDRDTWFFRDMFLRVMRSLDYLRTRPEWDGENLFVGGDGGLGGTQALAAAALDASVTLALVDVPVLCELNAHEAGRHPGMPLSYPGFADRLETDHRLTRASAYYDAVNFAPQIGCELYVSNGFTNETSFPSNLYAFFNALPETTRKTMTTNPRTGHYGTTENVKGDARLAEMIRNARTEE